MMMLIFWLGLGQFGGIFTPPSVAFLIMVFAVWRVPALLLAASTLSLLDCPSSMQMVVAVSVNLTKVREDQARKRAASNRAYFQARGADDDDEDQSPPRKARMTAKRNAAKKSAPLQNAPSVAIGDEPDLSDAAVIRAKRQAIHSLRDLHAGLTMHDDTERETASTSPYSHAGHFAQATGDVAAAAILATSPCSKTLGTSCLDSRGRVVHPSANFSTDVVVLSTANFSEYLNPVPLAVGLFHAPWNYASQQYYAAFSRAAADLLDAAKADNILTNESRHIALFAVDVEENHALGSHFKVSRFPQLIVFRHGVEARASENQAPTDADALVRYMLGLLKANHIVIDETEQAAAFVDVGTLEPRDDVPSVVPPLSRVRAAAQEAKQRVAQERAAKRGAQTKPSKINAASEQQAADAALALRSGLHAGDALPDAPDLPGVLVFGFLREGVNQDIFVDVSRFLHFRYRFLLTSEEAVAASFGQEFERVVVLRSHYAGKLPRGSRGAHPVYIGDDLVEETTVEDQEQNGPMVAAPLSLSLTTLSPRSDFEAAKSKTGRFTREGLLRFLTEAGVPLLGEFSDATGTLFLQRMKPILFFFTHHTREGDYDEHVFEGTHYDGRWVRKAGASAAGRVTLFKELLKVAQQRTDVTVVLSNPTSTSHVAMFLDAVDQHAKYGWAIGVIHGRSKYRFDPDAHHANSPRRLLPCYYDVTRRGLTGDDGLPLPIDSNIMLNFLSNISQGLVPLHRHTQPSFSLPRFGSGEPFRLTYLSFTSLVIDDADHDVLLLLYLDTGCPVSRALFTLFQEMARKWKLHDGLAVATMDAIANDHYSDDFSPAVTGLPAVLYVRRSDKPAIAARAALSSSQEANVHRGGGGASPVKKLVSVTKSEVELEAFVRQYTTVPFINAAEEHGAQATKKLMGVRNGTPSLPNPPTTADGIRSPDGEL